MSDLTIKHLTCKYTGVLCATCGELIPVGEPILWTPDLPWKKRVAHPLCGFHVPVEEETPEEPQEQLPDNVIDFAAAREALMKKRQLAG